MLLNYGPLDCKEIQEVNPKRDQSWVFIGRTDAETEAPILWPPDMKCWLFGKDPESGKDWGQQEKGMTGDEMVGRHHWLNGHEFWWTPGVDDGQGGLVCCGSWGCKESDKTKQLNWMNQEAYDKKKGKSTFYSFIFYSKLFMFIVEKLEQWKIVMM